MHENATAQEILAARDALEEEAAGLLGRHLLEFARLDSALGLCLVWIDGGTRIQELTKKVADMSFHLRLKFLQGHLASLQSRKGRKIPAYLSWATRAEAARLRRNKLVHGRWYIDPLCRGIVSITGLPTSPTQKEELFTLAELGENLSKLTQLQAELSQLRHSHPL